MVTVVKKVNMIKRFKDFNRASGAASCAWKVSLLQDFPSVAGVPEIWSEYCVNFASANEPSEGTYETCLSPPHAMNRRNDVMLAQVMNDEPLRPDHGAPVIIIPGYVGGRCVEWL